MKQEIQYREGQANIEDTASFGIKEEASEHQITVDVVGETTAGTATIGVRARGNTVFTLLKNSAGDLLELDLTETPQTIRFDGRFEEIQIELSEDFDGTSVTINAMGW